MKPTLFAVITAALLLTGCGGPAPVAQPSAAGGSVEVFRLAGDDFGYPQPYTFSRGPGNILMSYIFDTLVWHDSKGLIPWLATDWKPSGDGKTWTFALRQDVKWQDGQPFTADDVVFSFNYLKGKPNPWWASQTDLVDSVDKINDSSVTIVLKQPYAPFLTSIAASVVIFPKHIWEQVTDPRKFTDPQAFIGTGPYKLAQYHKDQGTYLFEANPKFFLGSPYVKRIEIVPASNELLALQQGLVDASSGGVQNVPTDDVLALFKDTSKFGIITAPQEWTMGLFFNMSKGGPLADVRFRQAVAHAIDYDDLIKRVLQGKGVPGNAGYVAPSSPWYNPNVQKYPHDVNKAKQLLQAAGYSGQSFDLIYADSDSPRNAELIKGYLAAAGIQVTPRVMERNARDAAATEGHYDMILVGFGGLGNDPDGMRGNFDSRSPVKAFTRVQGYKNPRFDQLAEKQLADVDEAERKQDVNEMQAILSQDVPMVSLYYPDDAWIYRKGKIDDWYFASGWYGGGTNGAYKQLFVSGKKTAAASNK